MSYTLRIAGLGHSITLKELNPETTTVADLKGLVEKECGLPPCYQRLISRGLNFDDEALTLAQVGLKDRTKLMLMHSEAYSKEKKGFEELRKLDKDIEDLHAKNRAENMEAGVLAELVTRLCCKLDAVDTQGSTNLRNQRKALLQKAQALESPSSAPDGHGSAGD